MFSTFDFVWAPLKATSTPMGPSQLFMPMQNMYQNPERLQGTLAHLLSQWAPEMVCQNLAGPWHHLQAELNQKTKAGPHFTDW